MNELFPEHSENVPENPSLEIARMLSDFGEAAGFDSETLDEIAQLTFEEAFETAYGYLTQAGIDADEAMAPWLEQPDQD